MYLYRSARDSENSSEQFNFQIVAMATFVH